MELLIGRTWGQALKHNRSLIHLDLSKNDIGEEICRLIGKGLKKNHTLFGLHMAGNTCMVNCFGHIKFD